MSAERVDVLLDYFNLYILNVMDVVAPVKVKKTLSKQKAPWRNIMTVKALKREYRKAEHSTEQQQ